MAPETFENPKSKDVSSSDDVSFVCGAYANPTANIQWLKHGVPVTEDSNHKIVAHNVTSNCVHKDHCQSSETACASISALTILSVEPDDQGNYTCDIHNGIGHVSKIATLTVNGM